MARYSYRVGVLPSQTYEEAPVTLPVWMAQRTRWMKGWMQTYIVHNHEPRRLLRDMGWRDFLAFEIYVGSIILSPLLHAVFIFSLLGWTLTGRGAPLPGGDWQSGLEFAILVVGYGSAFALTAAGLLRLGQRRLLALQLLLPLYWMLHSVATVHAGYQLLTRPHFWAKTRHGLTRLDRSAGEMATRREADPNVGMAEPSRQQ